MLLELVQSQAAAAADTKEGAAFRFENLGLTEIPDELIEALLPHKPSKLSFQANHLTSLPESLRRLQSLYYLDVSSNNLSVLPGVICDLRHLEILDLSHNGLQRLPADLARLGGIQVISLQSNRIEYAPPVLADLPNLTFVELDQNPLVMPPHDTEDKNDIEWLVEYIETNRPILEAKQFRMRSASDGRKRMGFVMDEAAMSTPTSPLTPAPAPGAPVGASLGTMGSIGGPLQMQMQTQPQPAATSTSTPLQPSPIIDNGAHLERAQDKLGERLLFALRKFFKSVETLATGGGWNALVQVLAQLAARVTDLSAALDAGVKYTTQCIKAIEVALEVVKMLQEQCTQIALEAELGAVRGLILDVFHCFYELQNAWQALGPAPGANLSLSSDYAVADDLLYNQLASATTSSRSVLSLLNDAISRSALESARAPPNEQLTIKVRDLSNVCISGVAATRHLGLMLEQRTTQGSVGDREKFWEAVNEFLKSIIAILGAAKSGIDSLPLLAEVRPQISTLARVAKEIPPLLEQSSFKMGNTSPRQSTFPLNPPRLITSFSVGATSPSIQMPTPLTATLGSAAQAVMSPGIQQQTPFFQDFRG